MTAMRAQIMRTLQFATIGAFVKRIDRQRIMRATITPAMRRCFSFGDSHCGTCSLKRLCKIAVCQPPLSEGSIPRKRGGRRQRLTAKARPITPFRTVASMPDVPTHVRLAGKLLFLGAPSGSTTGKRTRGLSILTGLPRYALTGPPPRFSPVLHPRRRDSSAARVRRCLAGRDRV